MAIEHDNKTEKIAEIIIENSRQKINNILIVGCGSGLEAVILANILNVDVTGIDIEDNFSKKASKLVRLELGNAMSLRFPTAFFDYIYSYHALEHIENPLRALKEMRRVVMNGGGYLIGTPNKNRMLGYIGSKDATMKQKINWNISDYKARLTGKFKNELGAHAGFSAPELEHLLKNVFRTSNNVSDIYYSKIYEQKKILLSLLKITHLSSFAYPSVYFTGTA